MRNFLKILTLITLVSACANNPPPTSTITVPSGDVDYVESNIALPKISANYSEIHFTEKPQIKLNVSKIDITSKFKPTFREPNVEHLMPLPLESGALNWAKDRLVVTNPDSALSFRFIVWDASVKEDVIKAAKMFGRDKSQYTARIDVAIQAIGTDGDIIAETTAVSWRKVTVPADISIAEREAVWYDLEKRVLNDFDAKIIDGINQYMLDYLVSEAPKQ